jgi:hypothetical protein
MSRRTNDLIHLPRTGVDVRGNDKLNTRRISHKCMLDQHYPIATRISPLQSHTDTAIINEFNKTSLGKCNKNNIPHFNIKLS